MLGIAHYDGYTAMTFAVEETGAVIRLRIEECEAARFAAQALPPEYRPARPARRRRGLFPALHRLLFGDAQEKVDGRATYLPDGMRFAPSGSEHQANETGNLGKGLPNDPDNVPENGNIVRVVIETMDGARLWERHPAGGMTATSYRDDGTLASIVSALEEALRQARGELGADDPHPVANVGPTSAEVERDIPPTAMRRGNSGR